MAWEMAKGEVGSLMVLSGSGDEGDVGDVGSLSCNIPLTLSILQAKGWFIKLW